MLARCLHHFLLENYHCYWNVKCIHLKWTEQSSVFAVWEDFYQTFEQLFSAKYLDIFISLMEINIHFMEIEDFLKMIEIRG